MTLTIDDYLFGKLQISEGRKRFPYTDTVGKVTIGVGFNLTDVGLYDNEIDFILRNRINLAIDDAKKIPVYGKLSPNRKAVLVEMVFNIGLEKVLGFKNMLSNLNLGIFESAAVEMLQSKWADQVGNRAIILAQVIRSDQVKNAPDMVE